MGSHSVTCHPTQANAPLLTPAMQVATRFTYPGGMESWVDLVDLRAPRPGVEPAIFRSRVWHQTAAPPRHAEKWNEIPRLFQLSKQKFPDFCTTWVKTYKKLSYHRETQVRCMCIFFLPSVICHPRWLCSLWNCTSKLTINKLVMALSPNEDLMIVAWVILTWYQCVTDGQTNLQ